MTATDDLGPLEELHRENEVLDGLLELIYQQAELLKEGHDLPSGEVSEALRLLRQYLKVHLQRMDNALGPEAREAAMPTCFPHLDRIVGDHEAELRLASEADQALTDYEAGTPGARERLSQALASFATRSHDVSAYESAYPLSCLNASLSEEAARKVSDKFHATDAEVEDLDRHIQRLSASATGRVASPLRVRCSEPGCSALGEGRTAPGSQGRLALVAPDGGWRASTQTVRVEQEGRVSIEVGFLCPDHARVGAQNPSSTPLSVREGSGGAPLKQARPSAPPRAATGAPSSHMQGLA